MSRAFSLLKGSKHNTSSALEPGLIAEESPPSYTPSAYTPSSQLQGATLVLKSSSKKGCSIRTVSVEQYYPDGKQSSTDSAEFVPKGHRFPVFSFGPENHIACAHYRADVKSIGYACQAYPGSFILTKHKDLANIYWYTVSPYGDELVAYKDKSSGLACWTFQKRATRPENAPLYLSLLRWLREHVEHSESALKESFAVFGPNGSYFARNATECVWHDVPDLLDNKMSEFLSTVETASEKSHYIPETVALGANGTALVLWPADATGSPRLTSLTVAGHFLRKWVTDKQFQGGVEFVSLNMCDYKDFFVCAKNGGVDMTFGAATAATTLNILNNIVSWMQEKATHEKRSFTVEITIGDASNSVTISPASKWSQVELNKK